MRHRAAYFPTVLLCGLVAGLLSSIPIISCVNCCFLAWVIAGGFASAKLVGDRTGEEVDPVEGLIIGVLAGLTCGFVTGILWMVFHLLLDIETMLEMVGIGSEEVSEVSEQPWIAMVGSFCIAIVFHPVFGGLGGLLGSQFTRRPLETTVDSTLHR